MSKFGRLIFGILLISPIVLKGLFISNNTFAAAGEISLEGKLEVLHFDVDFHTSYEEFWLVNNKNKRYLLHLSPQLRQLQPNSLIRVTGQIATSTQNATADVLEVTRTDILQVANASQTTGPGVHKTAVILFNFQNDPSEPSTPEFVRGLIFTDPQGVNAYYQENSFQKVSLSGKYNAGGDVFGWYTIPFAKAGCDILTWSQSARTMAEAQGYDLSGYDHYIYEFPRASDCPYRGVAEVGGTRVWINGQQGNDLWYDSHRGIIGHELGHNFGLWHSSSLICTAAGVQIPIGDANSCYTAEYGDVFSLMGGAGIMAHFTNFEKRLLGWYESPQMQVVNTSGDYILLPVETLTPGIHALIIPRSFTEDYYLEYRRPIGFDVFPISDPVVNGVTIRLGKYMPTNKTILIDTATSNSDYDFNDSPLLVGQTFFDPFSNIQIRTLAVDGNQATVRLSIPTPTPGPTPTPPPSTSPQPTPTPTSADLKMLIERYLTSYEDDFKFLSKDGKIDMLDAGYMIQHLSLIVHLRFPPNSDRLTISITNPQVQQDAINNYYGNNNKHIPMGTSTTSTRPQLPPVGWTSFAPV